MSRWKVQLYGIEWVDWAVDASRLPINLAVRVEADRKYEAIERAMDKVSEQFGAMIAATEQIEAKRV